MKRADALYSFFKALGIDNFQITKTTRDTIFGKVIYCKEDPRVFEKFQWHIRESDLPSENVFLLAELLAKHKLMSIDMIKVSRRKLYSIYRKEIDKKASFKEFCAILEGLTSVEVARIDKGEVVDGFYIHE
jgi:hypothetical protein